MKRKTFRWLFLGLGLGMVWLAWLAQRAAVDRVTLNVRNASLEQVIASIQWQTWEKIIVRDQTRGTVTLEVRDVPLTEVLELIAQQIGGSWNAVYALHASRSTQAALDRALKIGTNSAPGWKDLGEQLRLSPGMMFARNAADAQGMVTLQFENKPIKETARALSRFGKAQVVVDDRTTGTVDLRLEQVPFQEAVDQLARQLQRIVSRRYVVATNPKPQLPVLGSKEGSFREFKSPGGARVRVQMSPQPTQVPLGAGAHHDTAAMPEDLPVDLPPPEQIREQMKARLLESFRNSTPEQRAERWRQPHPMPGHKHH